MINLSTTITIQSTKLGKVLKKITQLDLSGDKYDIKSRVKALLNKWKSEMSADADDGVLLDSQQKSLKEYLSEMSFALVPVEMQMGLEKFLKLSDASRNVSI